MSRILLACAFVFGLLLSVVPVADATVTPVNLTCTSDPAFVIPGPGSYKLANGVASCASTNLIEIPFPNVTLDLNGMTVGGATGCTNGIVAEPAATSKVTIKNGTVRGCANNIDLTSAAKSTVSNVQVENATSYGVKLGASNKLTGSTIAGAGVTAYGVSAGGSDVISGNFFTRMTNWGLVAFNDSNKVLKNTFVHNAADSMFISGNSTTVIGNTLISNDGDGICITGSHNVVKKNTAIDNDDYGIEVLGPGPNTISANKARVNGSGGIAVGDQSNVSKNQALDNTGAGILVDTVDNLITATKIVSNKANGNSIDGIVLIDPLDGTTKTTVTKNTVNGNGGRGISTDGSPDPAGAHTNHALGNGGSPQCDANLC
jgi:parallel beta-helix repeat protein